MDRRIVWTFALATFVTLAGVLRQIPGGLNAPDAMPAGLAVAYAVVLFGLMAAHAKCYERWTPHAPNRILVNEFLTRAWFVLFGLVLVAFHGDTGPIYLVMASAWAVASWCTHYLILRAQKSYRALDNLAQHGLFLLGLALMALVSLRLAFEA
ncbi:MAG: hypothetical protein WC876_08180 [Candidatus Thermoplasmatota archaeon]|jgi:hypothetical protein